MGKRVIVVPVWQEPIEFETWKTLAGELACAEHLEETLQHFHHSRIDPAHIVDIPSFDKASFVLRIVPRDMWPNKRKRVALDIERVQQRIAQAIWKECGRLLARRLTDEAKALVLATRERVEEKAEIGA